jgi:hypothetical protein
VLAGVVQLMGAFVDYSPAGVLSQPDMMMAASRWVGRCRCGVVV